MAHVYSTAVAVLYGASRNVQNVPCVQAVNYSVIIVKIKRKNPQYHKQKALTMVQVN